MRHLRDLSGSGSSNPADEKEAVLLEGTSNALPALVDVE